MGKRDILKEIQAKKSEQNLEKAQGTATKLDGLEIIIPVKVGEENQLFESINAQKIVEKIKELVLKSKKHRLIWKNQLKKQGSSQLKSNLNTTLKPRYE